MSRPQPTQTISHGPGSEHGGAGPAQGGPLVRGATLGRYVVLELLGGGGMGVCYAAQDFGLDRRICLKLVRGSAVGAGLGAERAAARQDALLREARAAARVAHPNVITVHDVGTWRQGSGEHVFIAMELVDGGTVRDWLRQRARSQAEILEVFRQAARGLAAAHQAGLVHRDFKPDNLLVGRDGRVRVSDFGLALDSSLASNDAGFEVAQAAPGAGAFDGGRSSVVGGRSLDALRAVGRGSGTPAYMAPEQHLGEPASARTDQYSFAISLHEALCGASPFAGIPRCELGVRKAEGRFNLDRSLAPWLRAPLARALSPKPADRFDSMEAMLSALRTPRAPRRLTAAFVGASALALVYALAAPADLEHARRVGPVVLSDGAPAGDPASTPRSLAAPVRYRSPSSSPSSSSTAQPTPDVAVVPRASGAPSSRQPSWSDPELSSTGLSRESRPARISAGAAASTRPPGEGSAARPFELERLLARLEEALESLGLIEPDPLDDATAYPVLYAAAPGGGDPAASVLAQLQEALAGGAGGGLLFPSTGQNTVTVDPRIAQLEQALASADDPVEAASVRFQLAQALWDTDRQRAYTLAREAREALLDESDGGTLPLLDDVVSWMDVHKPHAHRVFDP